MSNAKNALQIFGIDFTSRPKPGRSGKAIVVAHALLTASLDQQPLLHITQLQALTDFTAFEHWLATPGPWVGGFDFPFGLPRAFVDAHVPGADWTELMHWVQSLSREQFCVVTHAAFSAAKGQPALKHRQIDALARSHSPLKTMDVVRRQAINPPVGLMFFEGAPRLLKAGLQVPGHCDNNDSRIALEVYPGWLAWALGERLYKNDSAATAPTRQAARQRLIDALLQGRSPLPCGVKFSKSLAQQLLTDASGDSLDAVLCAAMAAWAQQMGPPRYGLPLFDPVEGWIVGVPQPR